MKIQDWEIKEGAILAKSAIKPTFTLPSCFVGEYYDSTHKSFVVIFIGGHREEFIYEIDDPQAEIDYDSIVINSELPQSFTQNEVIDEWKGEYTVSRNKL
jgi:hypothetical protein